MENISYKVALGQRRIFSREGAKRLVPCITAVVIAWVISVLLTLRAQDAAAAQAATQLWVLPCLSIAAMVISVSVGGEAMIILFVTFVANVGISVQLLLDASAAQSLEAAYLTGFVLAVIGACAVRFISRCKAPTVEAISIVGSLVLFMGAMFSPAVNGSHIAVKVMGRSALVGQPMLMIALVGIAAAVTDMESGSPQRVLHAGVLLLTNGFFFVLMNELGSLLILFITVSLVLIASDGVKPIDLIPVGCLFASLSFLGWKALSILGTKLPHSLFGKIWNKTNARFAYVNVLSKMDSLSQEETLGAAYQPIQGQKAILTSKWLGHSPYDISIPAKSSDYVTCWIANRLGLAAVLAVVVLVYIIFIYGLIFSSRSHGMVSVMGVACASALAAGGALNLLGATNIFPAVGVSFPLLSEGTMNIIVNSMMTGVIVLSTIKEREEN